MEGTLVGEEQRAKSKGWKVKVEVKAEPGPAPDFVTFRMESKLKGSDGLLVFNKDTDEMPKRDYYLVEFDLDDESGLGLEFAPNPMHAFWVNVSSGTNPNPACPTSPAYSSEIYPVSVDEDKLTVRNEDSEKARFEFSLGFVKGGADPNDPTTHIRYDPGGLNQNGGFNRS